MYDLDVNLLTNTIKEKNNETNIFDLEKLNKNDDTKTNKDLNGINHFNELNLNKEKIENEDKVKPFHYCLTNPPFGIQSIPNADVKFLEVACKISEEAIFSIHKAVTADYLTKFLKERNFIVHEKTNFLFDIPKTYKFHKDSVRNIEVVFIDAISSDYS